MKVVSKDTMNEEDNLLFGKRQIIMRLFIAEKPSMAAEIAKVLGDSNKKSGYYEILNSDDIVTWAYGHILPIVP